MRAAAFLVITRVSRRAGAAVGGVGLTTDGQDRDAVSRTAAAYRKAAPILDGAWQMVAAVLAGTLGGMWLDGKFGTEPWVLLTGAVLGVGLGLFAFIRAALGTARRPPGDPGRGG